MYWSTDNASNPYITDRKWGLACPGSYLYLPADAGRTRFPWGRFSPSAVLNSFGFLFWSIYQQRSKAYFLFKVSSQCASRQKRKISRFLPPSRGSLSLGSRKVLTYPYCLSHCSCFFCPTSGTSSGRVVLFSHHLSLTYSLAMRIFYQEIEAGCSKWREGQRISYSYSKAAHRPLNLVVTLSPGTLCQVPV